MEIGFCGKILAVFILTPAFAFANEVGWSFDSEREARLDVRGQVVGGKGVSGKSVIFDGNALLSVKDSGSFTEDPGGFTLTVWVNPYRLSAGQQMIAAKNRYALGERQWSLMLDKDNRFRLYTHQGRWVTADSPIVPRPGSWYMLGVVIDGKGAQLWVNGELAGKMAMARALAKTEAPLTFGGVDDNGRIRQGLTGALDEVILYSRPLDAAQLAAKYKPVKEKHQIPRGLRPVELWTGDRLLNTDELEVLRDVQFHVIKKHEPDADGYHFLHGVGLVWHKDKLYASFGHNQGRENTRTEEGRYCVSRDGGKTWSALKTIDTGLDSDNLAVSHGVFLSHGGTLWAFLGAFYDSRQRVHTRSYTLNEATGKWESHGVVVGDGFWPMTEPVKMANGNWILPGFVVGQGNPAAVAVSELSDFSQWQLRVIPKGHGLGRMWGESSVLVDGRRIVNIARYGEKAIALAATSGDFGKTWNESKITNMPMAASKPCAGVLSNGQRYLIGSMTGDGGNRRSPLTIAVSRPGEDTLSKLFVIRHAVLAAGPGESHERAALSYPYATEYRGKLYVGYSNNGGRRANLNSAELAVIPIDALKVR